MRFTDMLYTRIDERVSPTERNTIATDILQEGEAYRIDKDILGNNIYTWSQSFIDKITEAFSTTIQPNFSVKQQKLFDEYIAFMQETDLVNASEEVIELDTYLGEL